jgi:hypothetical protein
MAEGEHNGNTFVALDSLCANEFEVEVDGEKVEGVFRVSGLTLFKAGGVDNAVLITKMVQRDGNNPVNRWMRETVHALGTEAHSTRTVSVVAIDDGVETRRWIMENAWITGVAYSEFNSGSTEMIEECIRIQYDSMRILWSTTANEG